MSPSRRNKGLEMCDQFFIFIDKDFEYKKILEAIFICTILLCTVHMLRYWMDKLLPSARRYDDEEQVTLNGDDKKIIYSKIQDLINSPTEDIYNQRLGDLFSSTENVFIKAGQYASSYEPFENVFN